MEKLVVFNPNPRIDELRLSNGKSCYVIDDALLDAERVAEFAIAQAHAFRPMDFNAYPGTYLLLPDDALVRLHEFFQQHMRRRFDARRTLRVHGRLAMVTLPPAALRPCQWICHTDGQDINPRESSQASVLYLFKDDLLGGTSFYEPARPREQTEQLFRDSTTLRSDDFARKYDLQPSYLCDSNAYFHHIGRVQARWNRIIFYDGHMLHSGDIFAPEKLSSDPRHGRLTLNGFFTSRRNAA